MAPPISTLGLQKAAILMVLLGEESASHIYRNLPEGDVERLTRRIAELEHFKPETAMSVLEEYYQLTLTQGYLAEGGPDYAQKLLVKAFGEAGAQRRWCPRRGVAGSSRPLRQGMGQSGCDRSAGGPGGEAATKVPGSLIG